MGIFDELNLFQTEPVEVRAKEVELDELGEPVNASERPYSVDVLVCPGATSDLDATRPNGVSVAYTLHFPKTFTQSLKACDVRVRGKWFSVVGDPQAYTPENTPGAFNRAVEVGRVDG